MSHAAASFLCRAIKLQCELYPSRVVALCLDPYSGLGFALWCLSRCLLTYLLFFDLALTALQPSYSTSSLRCVTNPRYIVLSCSQPSRPTYPSNPCRMVNKYLSWDSYSHVCRSVCGVSPYRFYFYSLRKGGEHPT